MLLSTPSLLFALSFRMFSRIFRQVVALLEGAADKATGSKPKGIVEEEEERLQRERNQKRMRPVLDAAARDDVAGIKGLITVSRKLGLGLPT